MNKFEYNDKGFTEAVEWAKTYIIGDGRTLYDTISSLHSSEEKLHFINKYRN